MSGAARKINKLKSLVLVCGGATVGYSALAFYQYNEKLYEGVLVPLVQSFDPETSHRLALSALKSRFLPKSPFSDPPSLKSQVWGISFSNPIGMAAGFDKDAEAVVGLHKVGFGFVEVGSVTPLPQPGNEKPRVFRLKENHAVINRYGFNSDGHEKVLDRIKELRAQGFQGHVGVNLGKNKLSPHPIKDYVDGIKLFGPLADYLVINISSPNTPGLRDWQRVSHLKDLLSELVATRDSLPASSRPPLLLKLSPDLSPSERADIAQLILQPQCRVDGLVIANTSTQRSEELVSEHRSEAGGLSGKPLTAVSTEMIAHMYRLTKGAVPIIGVGGVFTGQDAYDKVKAGASLVQIYTSFIYHGPPVVTKLKKELERLVAADGYQSVSEAVGVNATHPHSSAAASAH